MSENNSFKILNNKEKSPSSNNTTNDILSKNFVSTTAKNISINSNNEQPGIIEVYEDNFIQEIKRIGKYLKQYSYIGMDTEFPGVVYPCPQNSPDFYYQYVKANVDKLNLIQLGITLTNSKGERPPNTSTWQFNLKN